MFKSLLLMVCLSFWFVESQTPAAVVDPCDTKELGNPCIQTPGTMCQTDPQQPMGFTCVPRTSTTAAPTTANVNLCSGENDNCEDLGKSHGCKALRGECASTLQVRDVEGMEQRCYDCPPGDFGCRCFVDANGMRGCNGDLVCSMDNCVSTDNSQFGKIGKPCRSSGLALTQCDNANAFCAAGTCKACTPKAGELGCFCTKADDCQSTLTCDLPSLSCVPCRLGCSNNCVRTDEMQATVPPTLLCPTFDCLACRRNSDICKWCNRFGDRACVAQTDFCPSLAIYGDESIQCGGVLKAETIVPPQDLACSKATCFGCISGMKDCKFCGRGGDWQCVNVFSDCPSGIQDTPQEMGTCGIAVCKVPDCAGHGTCELEQFPEGVRKDDGRPYCNCVPGYKNVDDQGCVRVDILFNESLIDTATVSVGVVVGLLVGVVLYCIAVGFAALFLRRRAKRTIIISDESATQLEVNDDGTVVASDGNLAFKCLEEGCPKAYFTQEDLDKHIELRHGVNAQYDNGGGTFQGNTFNGSTFMGAPAGGYDQGYDQGYGGGGGGGTFASNFTDSTAMF